MKNNQVRQMKCKHCGTIQEVSHDGWLVDGVVRDERHNIVFVNGKPKREIRYSEWFHLVGHFRAGGKLCKGSGLSPAPERNPS